MSSAAKLKEKFKEIECDLMNAFNQREEAESAESSAKRCMRDLYESLREHLEAEHGVKIPVGEFADFVESCLRVMVIEGGEVRFFESEGEVVAGEGAVKIYARDWNSDYYDTLFVG